MSSNEVAVAPTGRAPRPAALVLASASPRRRAFLAGAGVPHTVAPVDLAEVPNGTENPEDFALRMASEKAAAAVAATAQGAASGGAARGGAAGGDLAGGGAAGGEVDGDRWVLASDTVVTLDGAILGKPSDPDEAARMLARLSGRTHTVITAFALLGPQGRRRVQAVHTAVTFEALDAAAIAAYVASGEPMDKAGAYGIQGLGGRFVAQVDGDQATVVGLPIGAVIEALEAEGVLAPMDAVARAARAVRGRIAAAADGTGRPASAVTLVAVSKKQPLAQVRAALAAGLVDLGENYVQDLVARAAALPQASAGGLAPGSAGGLAPGPRWHFIGHLQRNKCRALLDVAGGVVCVHGIDDLRTLETLGRIAADRGQAQEVLVQVRIGAEDSKSGVAPAGLAAVLAGAAGVAGVRVAGLMAVPPPARWGEARRYFAQLRALRDAVARPDLPLSTLSMGMSGDYEAAIAEGSTCVRVGTALFGARGGA